METSVAAQRLAADEPHHDELLRELEQAIGTKLPEDYRQFLQAHNSAKEGAQTEATRFNIVWQGQDYASRFPYDDVDTLYGLGRESGCDLLSQWQCMLGRVPCDTIPIGYDPGPNRLLLGIAGARRGQVLFWVSDGEGEEGDQPDDANVGFVATSFTAFFDALRFA